MEKQRNKVCGADIHKKFLVATILSRDGTKVTKRFGMTLDDLLEFRAWVMENQCEQVAVESTGVYWIPIHAVLEKCSRFDRCQCIQDQTHSWKKERPN